MELDVLIREEGVEQTVARLVACQTGGTGVAASAGAMVRTAEPRHDRGKGRPDPVTEQVRQETLVEEVSVAARSWDHVIPPEDRDIYELAGFGRKGGFGERPAILVIDVQYRTVGDRPAPIREAIRTMYPTACGERAWEAVHQIARLLEVARRSNVPVIYPCVAPKRAIDAGRFGQKNPQITSIPERGYAFVDEIAPLDGDIILPKRHASAFFGTALASYLIDFRVDTLFVTGCTTSGCVRATVADAFSYNFHTIVVEECVYDRIQISHLISLFDIEAKYADVISIQEACDYLGSLGAPAASHLAAGESSAAVKGGV